MSWRPLTSLASRRALSASEPLARQWTPADSTRKWDINPVVMPLCGIPFLAQPSALSTTEPAADRATESAQAPVDHFEPSQFQTRCSDGWRRLKATAVPSLFLHSESQQPAARTSGATLQVGLLTQPLPTTSGACFVSIFQGPAYPRVAILPRSSPQVTSDNQRGQASSAARGTLVSADSTSWQPAARTSGSALQGGLLMQPLPTTSGACFVSIFQGPAYPRVTIPPHPSLQVTSDNQRGQASAAALGTLVSAASTSWPQWDHGRTDSLALSAVIFLSNDYTNTLSPLFYVNLDTCELQLTAPTREALQERRTG
ncbi:peroxynitrite isomerase THAP4-like [Ixodes scapularis]